MLKKGNSKLPEDYLVNHITSSFVETISWWLPHNMEESPEQITEYFIATIEPIIISLIKNTINGNTD